jgi:tyrosinase
MANPQDPQKPAAEAPRVAEMVGATSEPFFLGSQPTEITLAMHAPTGPAASHKALSEMEVYLYIENLTCSKEAPPFRVYLNLPRGDAPEQHPELLVGNLGTFGVKKASDPEGPRGGNGLSFTVDLTDAVPRLIASKNWDPRNLRVTFSRGYWEGEVPQVKVGRVSLYFK